MPGRRLAVLTKRRVQERRSERAEGASDGREETKGGIMKNIPRPFGIFAMPGDAKERKRGTALEQARKRMGKFGIVSSRKPEADGIDPGVKQRPDSDFDPMQLAMGVKVEMEHTDDPEMAKKIAKDHLAEIPDYYTRLKKMEEEARTKAPTLPATAGKSPLESEVREFLNKSWGMVSDKDRRKMLSDANVLLEDYVKEVRFDRLPNAVRNALVASLMKGSDGASCDLCGKSDGREVDVRDFFIKAFGKLPENDPSDYSDWVRRFSRGNPEIYMDQQTLDVYRRMRRSDGLYPPKTDVEIDKRMSIEWSVLSMNDKKGILNRAGITDEDEIQLFQRSTWTNIPGWAKDGIMKFLKTPLGGSVLRGRMVVDTGHLENMLGRHDWTYDMSDDPRSRQAGEQEKAVILAVMYQLVAEGKKDEVKDLWDKYGKRYRWGEQVFAPGVTDGSDGSDNIGEEELARALGSIGIVPYVWDKINQNDRLDIIIRLPQLRSLGVEPEMEWRQIPGPARDILIDNMEYWRYPEQADEYFGFRKSDGIAESMHDAMTETGKAEAIDFKTHVGKWIREVTTEGGIPVFVTKYGGEGFDGMILGKERGGIKAVGKRWFKDIPPEDLKRIEEGSGDWKWLSQKYPAPKSDGLEKKECSMCTSICNTLGDAEWCTVQFTELREGKLTDRQLAEKLDQHYGKGWEDRVLKKK